MEMLNILLTTEAHRLTPIENKKNMSIMVGFAKLHRPYKRE
jgi:hypothetical protein